MEGDEFVQGWGNGSVKGVKCTETGELSAAREPDLSSLGA